MKYIINYLSISLLALTVFFGGRTTFAGLVLDAVDRGWWDEFGDHNSDLKTTYTGQNASGTIDYNSFFVFDLGSLSSTVSSGELRLQLETYFGPDPFEAFSVYDVQTPFIELTATNTGQISIFFDLQSGSIYGNGIATPALAGTVLTVPLLAPAINDINAARGGLFAIGVHLDQITLASGNEGMRWGGNAAGVYQLELNTVPEPTTLLPVLLGVWCITFRRPGKSSPKPTI